MAVFPEWKPEQVFYHLDEGQLASLLEQGVDPAQAFMVVLDTDEYGRAKLYDREGRCLATLPPAQEDT